jgi:hypothetical protein
MALARVMIIGALACGIIGLTVGVIDREWKLSVTGWFSGGTLLAIIAISIFIDEYMERAGIRK